ncbi:hypothetical protein [Halopiger thermotolerans]
MSANTGETVESESNTNEIGRRAFCVGAAGTVALAATGAAAAQEGDGDLTLNYSSDVVANPFISADVTIGTHKSGYDSPLMFENDNGEDVELPAEINDRHPDNADETTQNLFGFRADKVSTGAYNAWPRDTKYDESGDGDAETAVTAVDATHWSTDTSNTSGSLTVENGGDEVDSVRIAASSIASGENATATFDLTAHNAEITSDEEKRYLQLCLNVDALTSGAVVEIRAVDEDGDYKAGVIDPSADSSSTNVIATATGAGIVFQKQLADLTVQGSGDGAINNIQALEVDVAEADATVELFGIDLERKSKWEFGRHVKNENTDDEETVTVYEPGPGVETYTSLDGEILSNATIHDLEVPVKYTAAASDAGSASSTSADNYPQFDHRLEQVERLETETAIDLSHSNLKLELEQTLPTDRYHTLELATGTSSKDDPEDMSFSDVSGSLSGVGSTVVLEDLVESGKEYTVRIREILTSDEYDTATSVGTMGGGGGARSTGGGGWFSGARGALLAVFATLTGYFGIVKRRLPFSG